MFTKIKDLPPRLRALAESNQKAMSSGDLKADTVSGAFVWYYSPEGEEFWRKVDNGDFSA